MATDNLLRITVFAHRNPALSEEQFHAHWTTKHAPLVSSWLQRHGVAKYIQVRKPHHSYYRIDAAARTTIEAHPQPQYHTPSTTNSLTSQPTLSYDGMADFYVRSYADFEAAYEDSYYKDVVKPDEEYLFDVQSMRVMVGTETRVIEGGEIAGPGE